MTHRQKQTLVQAGNRQSRFVHQFIFRFELRPPKARFDQAFLVEARGHLFSQGRGGALVLARARYGQSRGGSRFSEKQGCGKLSGRGGSNIERSSTRRL
jgi:hypothetical protein